MKCTIYYLKNYKKRLIFPIDTNDPMNGIFSYLRKNNLLHLVYSYENSIFPGNSKAIALIENNTKTWYTSTGNINEYFELGILNYEVFVNGYGMMANANDDNVQHNWIVSCTDTSVERVIAHEINNNDKKPQKWEFYCITNSFWNAQMLEFFNSYHLFIFFDIKRVLTRLHIPIIRSQNGTNYHKYFEICNT